MDVARSDNVGLGSIYDNAGTAAGNFAWGSSDPSGDAGGAMNLSANQWQILGETKPNSSATVRQSRKQLGTGVWTRNDSAPAIGTSSGAAAAVISFGAFADSTGFKDMRIAVAAIWHSVLTDTDYTNIESNATSNYLYSLNPAVLIEFNQTSVATPVTDLTGGGANETSISGTTAVTGDDPAWTFGIGTPVTWLTA